MRIEMKAIRNNIRKQTGKEHLRRNLTFAAAVVVLAAAIPMLKRRLGKAIRGHCQGMIHDMEFGERPSCEMRYEMHRAMHRRMEKDITLIQASEYARAEA